MTACSNCGNARDVRRFCPLCGAEQGAEPADPFLGEVIAGRFEVLEHLSAGGMGVVYRAHQRQLERDVAIKFVHPHLVATNADARGIEGRFLVEARAASRLNHPHVVSIFDFGETRTRAGRTLYIVMELLSGHDLGAELAAASPLPLARVARIFEQALSGLGEAHDHGITHRDVKPDNILLERTRSGGDHVKLIDFGVAKLGTEDRAGLTLPGHVVGTPCYMPLEQIEGCAPEPGFDLWAMGVVLFTTLTGQLPFAHAPIGPPPDPRDVAPEREIPAALADVCRRALGQARGGRFPDAESFADAIVRAATTRPAADRSIFPARQADAAPARAPSREELATTLPPSSSAALVGRDPDVAWARGALADPLRVGALVWGRTGTGRTRILEEVAAALEEEGALVVWIAAEPPPADEEGFSGLRRILLGLVGVDTLAELAARADAAEARAAAGLRAIFGEDPSDAAERSTRAAAVAWAARVAVSRGGGGCTLVLDDLDHLDRASRRALVALLEDGLPRGLRVLFSSASPAGPRLATRVRERRIGGLPRAALLGAASPALLERITDRADVEPLFVFLAGAAERRVDGPFPEQLPELFAVIESVLTPAERRVALALTIVGSAEVDIVARVAEVPDIGGPLGGLIGLGVVRIARTAVGIAHRGFAEAVLATVPVGALARCHVRAGDALATVSCERAAHHAIRGEPDLAAFLLVERVVRLRRARGDDAGALDALAAGVAAARGLVARGEPDAADVFASFAEQLGAAMLDDGRAAEGASLLREVVEAGALHRARARALAHLAGLAAGDGDPALAQRLAADAAELARRLGDAELAASLALANTVTSGAHPSHTKRGLGETG